MQLFYNPNITETDIEVIFDKEESRHITKVLRKNEGDLLHITNGKGFLFDAALSSTHPKNCIATIKTAKKLPALPYHLHLAVAPTKSNDRYEWFLEKATEIGVSEITPIICEHSERKAVKLDRFEKIIQSAMKQSLKTYLPKLNSPMYFKEFLASKPAEELKFIAHCEESKKSLLKAVINTKKSMLILIGPEGDFSNREIHQAISEKYIPISLGISRLRTETAALTACHSVYFTDL